MFASKRRFTALLLVVALLVTVAGCVQGGEREAMPPEKVTPPPAVQEVSPAEVETPAPEETEEVPPSTEGKLAFRFLDIPELEKLNYAKWGDATLITFPTGETMMIDVGEKDYTGYIINSLKDAGIQKINYIVITHFHSDHYGGLQQFLDAFEVDTVYFNGAEIMGDFSWKNVDGTNERVIGYAEAAGVNIEYLIAGDSVQVGDVQIDALFPAVDSAADTTNDGSLVLKISYGEQSALFTGDLYYSGEAIVLEEVDNALLNADLLKIMHHGNNSSGSQEFIDAVSPVYAVAMGNFHMTNVGKNRYTKIGCQAMETIDYGNVYVTFDGQDEILCWTDRAPE